MRKNIPPCERMIAINMIKYVFPNEETFRELFLKQFFLKVKHWGTFIKSTEAGKKPVDRNFQEHFNHWLDLNT